VLICQNCAASTHRTGRSGKLQRAQSLSTRGGVPGWGVLGRELANDYYASQLTEDVAPRALPELLRASRHSEPGIRAAAAAALGALRLRDAGALVSLERALSDEAFRVRLMAAHAFLELKASPSAAALPYLIQDLQTEDDDVREVFSNLLEQMGPVGVPALAEVLSSDDAGLRAEAAALLGLIFLQPGGPVVPSLILLLEDPAPEVREAVVRALMFTRDPRARAPLVTALEDPAPEVRRLAAHALSAFGEVEQVVQAAGLLDDENERVRESVERILSSTLPHQKADVMGALLAALRDPRPQIRAKCALALGQFEQEKDSVEEPLRQLLRDEDPTVRASAAVSMVKRLGVHTTDTIPALREGLLNEDVGLRADSALALRKLGPEAAAARPDLHRALKDPNGGVLRAVALALHAIDPAETAAVPILSGRLKSEDRHSCDLAVRTLSGMGEIGALALGEALATTRVQNPSYILNGLRSMGAYALPAVPAIATVLHHPDTWIRIQAVDALTSLARLGPEGQAARQALVLATQNPDASVRKRAMDAIGRYRIKEGLPALAQAIQDESVSWVRFAASSALSNFDADSVKHAIDSVGIEALPQERHLGWYLAGIGEPVVPSLISALDHPDKTVRGEARSALGRIGTPAIPALVQALRSGSATAKNEAAMALGSAGRHSQVAVAALIDALDDGSQEVRDSAIRSLAHQGSEAVDPLIQVLRSKDSHPDPRGAVETLRRIGPAAQPAIPALADHVGTYITMTEEVMKALSSIGETAVPTLIGFLEHEKAYVRSFAARALGKIGSPARPALPRLQELMASDDEKDSIAAAQAISKIIGDRGS